MCGTHHVPALMFQSSFVNTEKLGIDTYEVLPVEIPCHVIKPEKIILMTQFKPPLLGKEVKRGADYRKSLVDVTIYLDEKFDTRFFTLLGQLYEVQQILYSGEEEERSSKSVLRLHSLTFLHATMGKPKSLTSRRLFG